MDLHAFQHLLTPAGQEALVAAEALQPVEADFLAHFQALSRRFQPELARAALQTAILRREAAGKFPAASKMYFTREALEQASSWEISAYRAKRYHSYARLSDLGCSIGGDTLALAEAASVIGLDLDPLRLRLAQENLRALGWAERTSFIQADLLQPLPFAKSPDMALFFDPARRSQSRRVYSVSQYQPPLQVAQAWLNQFPALGVKISPGVNLREVEPLGAEVEFISLRGELKEAVLWFGPLKTASRRATLLPGGFSLVAGIQENLPISEPRAFLYEPDPAVLRAGLVAALGVQLEACQLDPDIAYLTSDRWMETPFARVWQVEDWLPFGLKRLRSYLRQRGVGQVIVKKRGSPLQPEELIQKLKLTGNQRRVLFLTHLRGRPIVVIALEL